jgi:hypothetical protein
MSSQPYYTGDKDSQIIRLAMEYKAKLNSDMVSVERNLTHGWQALENNLVNGFFELEREFKGMPTMPDEITIQWLRKQARYKTLQTQTTQQLANYANQAEKIISVAQHEQAGMAIRQAYGLATIGMQNPGFTMLPTGALESLIGSLYEQSPLRELLLDAGAYALYKTQEVLPKELALGTPLREIGRILAKESQIGLNRSLVIARTEIMRARRTATHEQFLEMKDHMKGWKRMANKATGCCACLALDGMVYPPEEPLEDHPNGQCVAVPWVKDQDEPKWETGEEYFKRLPEAEQRKRMGNQKYDLWKKGEFKFGDLANWTHSDKWGWTPTETPLWKLEGHDSYNEKLTQNQQTTVSDGKKVVDQYRNVKADSELKQQYADYVRSELPPENQQAVFEYTGSGYRQMNNHLRLGNSIAPTRKKEIGLVQEALENAPKNKKSFMTFRGVGGVPSKYGIEVGKPFKDAGFMSTTIDEYKTFSGKTKFNIFVPAGSSNVAHIREISAFPSEDELLFNSSSLFEVVDIRDNGYKYEVDMIYLGREP